jgi:hypothetical protein
MAPHVRANLSTPRDWSISAVRAPLNADCNDSHCNQFI